jgi:uncharacterized protein (TIGR02246 family)
MSARDDVLKVIREQERAVARADARAANAVFADDVVVFDLPPPLEYRGEDVIDPTGLEDWFATWKDGVTVELHEPTVLVEGDLAVVFGLSRMRGVKKVEGPLDSWNRRTVVLRQMDGRWMIVHTHDSYPMKMDGSGKVATDLTP